MRRSRRTLLALGATLAGGTIAGRANAGVPPPIDVGGQSFLVYSPTDGAVLRVWTRVDLETAPAPLPTPTPPPPPPVPVILPVSLGDATIFATDDSGNGGGLFAQKVLLGKPATLISLAFYVTNPAGLLRLGVYDSQGPNGGPGIKLAETVELTPVAGWNVAGVVAAVLPVLGPGTYWLAYAASDNALGFRVDRSAGGQNAFAFPGYGPLPQVYPPAPQTGVFRFSFYASLVSLV